MAFKMAPLVDFAFKTELQCLPGHHVNFRKQTYGDCGFVFSFDYNKYLIQKYKTQSQDLSYAPSPSEKNSLLLACRGTYLHSQNYHRITSTYSLYYQSQQDNFKWSQVFEVPLLRNALSHLDKISIR